jgi:hypothetical protein
MNNCTENTLAKWKWLASYTLPHDTILLYLNYSVLHFIKKYKAEEEVAKGLFRHYYGEYEILHALFIHHALGYSSMVGAIISF